MKAREAGVANRVSDSHSIKRLINRTFRFSMYRTAMLA
jgi:hypothetical protein